MLNFDPILCSAWREMLSEFQWPGIFIEKPENVALRLYWTFVATGLQISLQIRAPITHKNFSITFSYFCWNNYVHIWFHQSELIIRNWFYCVYIFCTILRLTLAATLEEINTVRPKSVNKFSYKQRRLKWFLPRCHLKVSELWKLCTAYVSGYKLFPHSRHGCLCMLPFCGYVVLCVGSGLAMGGSLVQGVPPSM
jgi:hypothetical protein